MESGRKALPGGDVGKKKKDEMTLLQKKFVKYYLETGNKTESAKKAGYKPKNRNDLCVIGIHNIKALYPKIEDLMERMGLDDVHLLSKLRDGLEATEMKTVITVTEGEKISEQQEFIDYGARHRYLETALEMKGKFRNKANILNLGGGKVSVNLGLAPDLKSKLDEIYNH